jgi:hypothetical protein
MSVWYAGVPAVNDDFCVGVETTNVITTYRKVICFLRDMFDNSILGTGGEIKK